jgi:hypothetical protein
LRIKPLFQRGDFAIGQRILFGAPVIKGTVTAVRPTMLSVLTEAGENKLIAFVQVRATL